MYKGHQSSNTNPVVIFTVLVPTGQLNGIDNSTCFSCVVLSGIGDSVWSERRLLWNYCSVKHSTLVGPTHRGHALVTSISLEPLPVCFAATAAIWLRISLIRCDLRSIQKNRTSKNVTAIKRIQVQLNLNVNIHLSFLLAICTEEMVLTIFLHLKYMSKCQISGQFECRKNGKTGLYCR